MHAKHRPNRSKGRWRLCAIREITKRGVSKPKLHLNFIRCSQQWPPRPRNDQCEIICLHQRSLRRSPRSRYLRRHHQGDRFPRHKITTQSRKQWGATRFPNQQNRQVHHKNQLKQDNPLYLIIKVEDEITGLNNIDIIYILDHVQQRRGKINDNLIYKNNVRFREPFDATLGMAAYIRQIED